MRRLDPFTNGWGGLKAGGRGEVGRANPGASAEGAVLAGRFNGIGVHEPAGGHFIATRSAKPKEGAGRCGDGGRGAERQ